MTAVVAKGLLAVMERDARFAQRLHNAMHESGASLEQVGRYARESDEARATVAELIEAAGLARVELKRQHAYSSGDEAGKIWHALQAIESALSKAAAS